MLCWLITICTIAWLWIVISWFIWEMRTRESDRDSAVRTALCIRDSFECCERGRKWVWTTRLAFAIRERERGTEGGSESERLGWHSRFAIRERERGTEGGSESWTTRLAFAIRERERGTEGGSESERLGWHSRFANENEGRRAEVSLTTRLAFAIRQRERGTEGGSESERLGWHSRFANENEGRRAEVSLNDSAGIRDSPTRTRDGGRKWVWTTRLAFAIRQRERGTEGGSESERLGWHSRFANENEGRREEVSLNDSLNDSPLPETRLNERTNERTNDSFWWTERRELIRGKESWNPPLLYANRLAANSASIHFLWDASDLLHKACWDCANPCSHQSTNRM